MKKILNQYTVLYAEDDAHVQSSVVEYLSRYFKEVYVANDGKEALSFYGKKSPDALILDIDMPYIDGLKLAKIIRETNSIVPIVMLTAFTDTDKLLKATELNLCKYLVKPVDPFEFKEVMQKLSLRLEANASICINLQEGYRWNKELKELSHHGTVISLSQKEQILLNLFVSKRDECVTFTEIMALVWEESFDVEISIQSVKFQVTLLRKKLPKNSIKNVYGKGYIFS
ncbi:response regulator transcription factor [bacterium]|nr:response regulator transcription factor [bacterium]MBU1956945.1 response regulator transcription factor [bacterium]